MTIDRQGTLYAALFIIGMVLIALAVSGCTKQVPVKVIETEIVRVEVPTPVLQRCIPPETPPLPKVVPYKCTKDHLCLDRENKNKLEQMFMLMIWYIDWLEKHCTEQPVQEVLEEEMQKEKGPPV